MSNNSESTPVAVTPQSEYLQFGGQAIIEGVMMRSPKYFSVACRAPNGQLIVTTEAIEKTWIGRQQWLKAPFLRGALALVDGMTLGIKAMKFASDIQLLPRFMTEEERAKQAALKGEGDAADIDEAKKAKKQKRVQDAMIGATLVFSIGFGLIVFQGGPNVLSAWLGDKMGWPYWAINLTTEIVKIVLFLGYIWAISFMPEIRRVFQYHGAEHKAINVIEKGEELNIENCRKMTRLHPRCGTSFAIVVLIVSLVIFTFMPRPDIKPPIVQGLVRFLIEIPAMFFIAGISYEAIRMAGKFRDARWVNMLFAPGLATQYLTTREPDDTQIEVAIESLNQCLKAERGEYVPEGMIIDGQPDAEGVTPEEPAAKEETASA